MNSGISSRSRFFHAVIFSAGALLCAPGLGWAASLKEVLKPEDFERAGLNKLTPEELSALDRLVEVRQAPGGRGAETAPDSGTAVASPTVSSAPALPQAKNASAAELPHGEDAFGNETRTQKVVTQIQKAPTELRSRIVGEFFGWSGSTQFVLENGQVWRQAEASEFPVHLQSPAVVIRKGALGTYFLSIEGYGSRVKVRRVK